jgi:D-arabinose 1-dehydrogenase-like Zn-dependent alcohol dehydrogenase
MLTFSGTDIAGEVVGLGPGVTTFAVGDKVSSWLGLKKGGSLAEYAVAPITSTVKRPEGVSAIDGASLGVAGSTALQALRDLVGWKFDGSQKTQKNLLITAASGGVGTYAVQVLPFSLQAWVVFFFPYIPCSIDEYDILFLMILHSCPVFFNVKRQSVLTFFDVRTIACLSLMGSG